jgi:DNA-binding NtrC family response regulator
MRQMLIADDEQSILDTLKIFFENEGYGVDTALGAAAAKSLMDGAIYDLVITDLRLMDGSGEEILEYSKGINRSSEVIIMTAYGTVESAVRGMKMGAFDYVIKPVSPEKLLLRVQRAVERQNLMAEVGALRKEFFDKYSFQNIMGKSPRLLEALGVVSRVAATDVSVLIEGENGTGKDLFARAIHNNSPRAQGPFVAINCSGLNEGLLDSELFGHVRGAFTGAIANRTGLFEESNGGTLFLDEVGSMPLSVQAKLLRVLQDRIIQRLGSNKMVKIDTRLITASNRKLLDLVKKGEFREDLYYRIRVVEIRIPSLIERRSDILLLSNFFLEKFSKAMGRNVAGFSREAMNKILEYHWPGNVRELENSIESAVALCRNSMIEMDDLPKSISTTDGLINYVATHSAITLEELEKRYIIETLKAHNWNQKKTADNLAIGRNTLWRKIRKYRIQIPPPLKLPA